jgi:hypothetical protein
MVSTKSDSLRKINRENRIIFCFRKSFVRKYLGCQKDEHRGDKRANLPTLREVFEKP